MLPTAKTSYTSVVNSFRLVKSQSHQAHVSFEMEYTIPYLFQNIRAGVYTIEAQLLNENGTLILSSIKSFTNDFHFMINAFLTSTVFYPLVSLGLMNNGEVRRMICFPEQELVGVV